MSAESEILALEDEIFDAIRTKDAARLRAMLTDDFVFRSHDGLEANADAFAAMIAAIEPEILSVTGSHLKVDLYGEVGVLTGVQRAEVAEGVSATAFTDVFVSRDARWKLAMAFSVELPG